MALVSRRFLKDFSESPMLVGRKQHVKSLRPALDSCQRAVASVHSPPQSQIKALAGNVGYALLSGHLRFTIVGRLCAKT